MRYSRQDQYLAGDAQPETIRRGTGSARDDIKKMNAWLSKRGIPNGWRKPKPKTEKKA